MKKYLFLLSSLVIFTFMAFMAPPKNFVGHWIIRQPDGHNITVDFTADGLFKTSIPDENFTVEGKYKIKDDVIALSDPTCGEDYWGTYKATFFSADSVYATVIEDSCTGRKYAADKATLIRVKK